MTDLTKTVRSIEGMENFEEAASSMPYIKIINGKAAIEYDIEAGSIVNIATKEVLAKKGTEFKFIPIYYFRRWSIWNKKTRTLEKFAFSKKGVWSDGSTIEFEDMNWNGSNPPLAQESLEFVILPTTELKKPVEEQCYSILSLGYTNKFRIKTAKLLEQLIYQTCIDEKVTKMYACAYSLKATVQQDGKGNSWYDYDSPKFVKKIAEDSLAIAANIYNNVKDINKAGNAVLIDSPSYESIETTTIVADVVDNTEF